MGGGSLPSAHEALPATFCLALVELVKIDLLLYVQIGLEKRLVLLELPL